MKESTFLRKLAVTWGIAGGGIVWMIHFLIIYALAEWGCVLNPPVWNGILSTNWAIFILTLALLVPAFTALYISHRSKDAFLRRYGYWANSVFILLILAEIIPVFYFLEAC